MENKNNEKQQQDYLNKFLNNTEKNIEEIKDNVVTSTHNTSLDYLSVDLDQLPLGIFYKTGTQIKIRSAKVHEVQAYSVVDDKNFLDVTEKMNQMLSSCVKVTLPNGKKGNYKDIKDGDRLFIIFMIRELTFQKGNSLAKEVQCKNCKHEFQIPFRSTANASFPKTFVTHKMPELIEKFFNRNEKCFEFNINGETYRLAPPTIGIQELFYNEIKNKVQNQKEPNVAFMKIIPFLLYDRIDISEKGIKAKEEEFKNMDMETFQILNKAVDTMEFGIKELKMECPSCGEEVHTDMSFPNGASSLFVVSNPFDDFVKK